MVNKELVLFLFQLEMDAQLQRALAYENMEAVAEIRSRREQVDNVLRELQVGVDVTLLWSAILQAHVRPDAYSPTMLPDRSHGCGG